MYTLCRHSTRTCAPPLRSLSLRWGHQDPCDVNETLRAYEGEHREVLTFGTAASMPSTAATGRSGGSTVSASAAHTSATTDSSRSALEPGGGGGAGWGVGAGFRVRVRVLEVDRTASCEAAASAAAASPLRAERRVATISGCAAALATGEG